MMNGQFMRKRVNLAHMPILNKYIWLKIEFLEWENNENNRNQRNVLQLHHKQQKWKKRR